MRSLNDVSEMLDKFDQAYDKGDLDADTEAVRDALTWVMEFTGDETLLGYLPDEE